MHFGGDYAAEVTTVSLAAPSIGTLYQARIDYRDALVVAISQSGESTDTNLVLERARFGERLQVTLQVAPEVLPVAVPVFVLQPLVENAVRHGLEKKPGQGHIKDFFLIAAAPVHTQVE